MKDRSVLSGHIACFMAYAIFGVNIIVCKDLTGGHLISPISIFTLRSLGAGLLFWILSLFFPAEKVEKRDYLKIFAAAFLGYFVTQLTFLMARSASALPLSACTATYSLSSQQSSASYSPWTYLHGRRFLRH